MPTSPKDQENLPGYDFEAELKRERARLAEMNEPFGRQPLPVTVTITGDQRDIDYWFRVLFSRAEFKGDSAQRLSDSQFRIYPRAVND